MTVKSSYLFINALSTLSSLNPHPALFKAPVRAWLAALNVNLLKLGLVTSQNKQDIPLYLDQKCRTNFADLLTKFSLESETPEKWLELQRRLLQPSWMLPHPKFWLKTVLEESSAILPSQVASAPKNFEGIGITDQDPAVISIHQICISSRT